jgi:hypothetical protein
LTRRIRTNTPLQALTLLNDSTYWDLSVKLAQNLLQDKKLSLEQRIGKGYALATGHPINDQKTKALQQLYASSYQKLEKDKSKILGMLSDSVYRKQGKELAAFAVVTNAILNLDEVITKN